MTLSRDGPQPGRESPDTRNGLTWAQAVVVFIGGGLLISIGDRAHIAFGVLTQNDTSFWGQAWWVVPMFGAVSLALVVSYRALRGWLDEPASDRDPQSAGLSAALFLLAYCSTGPFAQLGLSLAALLVGLFVLRVLLHRENRATLVLSIIIAVFGPLGEVLVYKLGMFHYTNPDLGLVHSWLPAVYLHGGLVIPKVEALFSTSKTVPTASK